MSLRVRVAAEMTDSEKQEFIDFVLRGGQVNPHSLPGLVNRAVALITLHDGGTLIGTAALKVPNESYRYEKFKSAGASESASDFPIELGWVHSHQTGSGNGRRLLRATVEAVDHKGVYATTKTAAMSHMLPSFGFKALGRPFPSTEDPASKLILYVRSAR